MWKAPVSTLSTTLTVFPKRWSCTGMIYNTRITSHFVKATQFCRQPWSRVAMNCGKCRWCGLKTAVWRKTQVPPTSQSLQPCSCSSEKRKQTKEVRTAPSKTNKIIKQHKETPASSSYDTHTKLLNTSAWARVDASQSALIPLLSPHFDKTVITRS